MSDSEDNSNSGSDFEPLIDLSCNDEVDFLNGNEVDLLDDDIEPPREAYFDNLMGNINQPIRNRNTRNDDDYQRAINESINEYDLNQNNDAELELAIANSIKDFEISQSFMSYNNKMSEQDIEKQIRTESLSKFIEQLKKFIVFEKSEIGQRILNVVEKYINCEIDNVKINSIDYENIFNFIKNIRISNDTRELLNNIIIKF